LHISEALIIKIRPFKSGQDQGCSGYKKNTKNLVNPVNPVQKTSAAGKIAFAPSDVKMQARALHTFCEDNYWRDRLFKTIMV